MADAREESMSWWIPDDEPTEYALPCDSQDSDDIGPISSWLASISMLEGGRILDVLAEVWGGVKRPGPKALREVLLTFAPRSIVIHEGRGWLTLGNRAGSPIHISPPPESRPAASGVESLEGFDTRSLLEFYEYFPGLRETPPGMSGLFLDPHEWQSVADYGWDLESEDESWSDGPVLFEALNGDLLLLNASAGSLAWCQMSNFRIRPLCDCFDEFLVMYARFLANHYIIDSYSLTQGS